MTITPSTTPFPAETLSSNLSGNREHKVNTRGKCGYRSVLDYSLTSIHDYWKAIALTRQTFFGKVMSLLFNMLSTLIFMAAVTICSDFGAQKDKV